MSDKHEDQLLIQTTLSNVKDYLLHTKMFCEIAKGKIEAQLKVILEKVEALEFVKNMQINYLSEVYQTSEKLSQSYKSNIKMNEDIAQKISSSLKLTEDNEKDLSSLVDEVRKISDAIERVKSVDNCNGFSENVKISIEKIEKSAKQLHQSFKGNKENAMDINNNVSLSINLIKNLNEFNQNTSLVVDNIGTFVENIQKNIDDLKDSHHALTILISNMDRLHKESKEKLEHIEKAMQCALLSEQ